jgi:transglutaminase-like putative cysteine protease
MKFDTYFRACSYAMIACGVLALALAGGVGAGLVLCFAAVLVVSWRLEGRKWQLSERTGMVVVLLALPLFYLDWKMQAGAAGTPEQVYPGISALVHLTLLLSSIKLLQTKADRDWLFLYLISFFEVLLAAGLSVSPLFLLGLGIYIFSALLSIVCFELRKSSRVVAQSDSRLLVANDPKFLWRKESRRPGRGAKALGRLPAVALCLFALILLFALPIFFVSPRASNGPLAMAGGTASTGYVGFSDRMTLGDIGRLQESNQLVMRVRVDEPQAARNQNLRWRGVALDRFDGRRWFHSSKEGEQVFAKERNLFPLGTTEELSRLTTQTFFVEPIDTPVLFAAPRAVAVQGALSYLRRDAEDGLVSRLHLQERISYKVFSDTVEPAPERLRTGRQVYPAETTPNLRLPIENYLQLPADLDTRIGSLASLIVLEADARNAYDAARAIEAHFNRNEYSGAYSYSLDMKATGREPLSDFLFRVRAGHCEYFSSAMTIMMRTQGVAARVVNGFQSGEYNSAADAYTVRQADAHSWVEVYFPSADAWVAFDPTPASGRPSGAGRGGLQGQLQMYADALELFWIQYVVAYDRQGQRSLARSLRTGLGSYRNAASRSADELVSQLKGWLGASTTTGGLLFMLASPYALGAGVLGFAALGFFVLRGKGFRLWRARRAAGGQDTTGASVIEFYERMTEALAAKGVRRRRADETPMEFAQAIGIEEVLAITQAYHRVRYGARPLSKTEAADIERCLMSVEREERRES